MQTDEPRQVYAAKNLQEAHLILDVLSDQGIEGRIASSGLESVYGGIPFQLATCPVWVQAADAERALAAIRAWESRVPGTAGAGIFCYHCGAALDEQLAICPSCACELDWFD